jgi:hypothetical protein
MRTAGEVKGFGNCVNAKFGNCVIRRFGNLKGSVKEPTSTSDKRGAFGPVFNYSITKSAKASFLPSKDARPLFSAFSRLHTRPQ